MTEDTHQSLIVPPFLSADGLQALSARFNAEFVAPLATEPPSGDGEPGGSGPSQAAIAIERPPLRQADRTTTPAKGKVDSGAGGATAGKTGVPQQQQGTPVVVPSGAICKESLPRNRQVGHRTEPRPGGIVCWPSCCLSSVPPRAST